MGIHWPFIDTYLGTTDLTCVAKSLQTIGLREMTHIASAIQLVAIELFTPAIVAHPQMTCLPPRLSSAVSSPPKVHVS
jgi:hypothetical protein